MSAVIFAGSNVKTLKKDLLFNEAGTEYAGYLMRSGIDPRVTATSGNRGTILVDIATGFTYRKLDTGSSVNWERLVAQGGSRLSFLEIGNAPIQTIVSNYSVYLFESGLAQEIYSEYNVPASYISGTPLAIKAKFFSPSSSGTQLLSCEATLIRTGTDDIASVTNVRTSTNAAITTSGLTFDIPQAVTFDITSTIGQINGVNVSANDTILIKIFRGTDTSVIDINFLYKNVEVILL